MVLSVCPFMSPNSANGKNVTYLLILHSSYVETVHAAFFLSTFPSGSWLLCLLFAWCHSEEIS
jgi:hypothetical protein